MERQDNNLNSLFKPMTFTGRSYDKSLLNLRDHQNYTEADHRRVGQPQTEVACMPKALTLEGVGELELTFLQNDDPSRTGVTIINKSPG